MTRLRIRWQTVTLGDGSSDIARLSFTSELPGMDWNNNKQMRKKRKEAKLPSDDMACCVLLSRRRRHRRNVCPREQFPYRKSTLMSEIKVETGELGA